MESNSGIIKTGLLLLLLTILSGCVSRGDSIAPVYKPTLTSISIPISTSAPTPISTATNVPTPTSTITPIPTATTTPTPTPRVVVRPAVRSVDLIDFQSRRNGAWFNNELDTLPEIQQKATATFGIQNSVVKNRRNGQIARTLIAGYVFIEANISSSTFDRYDDMIGALFLRVNLMGFVDYLNNRSMTPWNKKSINIPFDVRGIVALCNQKNIPVFLQANYADYVPGPAGTGIESLQRTDTVANLIAYLKALRAQGIHVDGITFGDELEDPAGYGELKPTLSNSDFVGRFISFASTLKAEFPELKIYAFDSYVSATRGNSIYYLELLQRIRQAEIKQGKNLLDGFVYRESYVYIDENGKLLDSQLILDDMESLYRDTPVYRYDVFGTSHPNPNRDYLHMVINKTTEIFGRSLDIGLTEYLPAGPVNISEIDTSRYSDMDFIIHYSDVVGIYAQLGLDVVSKIMFGSTVNQHKAFFDIKGNLGINYPVHEQLAQHFVGEILNVDRSVDYDSLKVKVYATRKDKKYFVMILNKDVGKEATIRVTLPDQLDLTVRLPRRSYTSLTIDDKSITISGVGN